MGSLCVFLRRFSDSLATNGAEDPKDEGGGVCDVADSKGEPTDSSRKRSFGAKFMAGARAYASGARAYKKQQSLKHIHKDKAEPKISSSDSYSTTADTSNETTVENENAVKT